MKAPSKPPPLPPRPRSKTLAQRTGLTPFQAGQLKRRLATLNHYLGDSDHAHAKEARKALDFFWDEIYKETRNAR